LSIRKSFSASLSLFQEGIDLEMDRKLKKTVEDRFAILLLRVNNFIREARREGREVGDFYYVSNLLFRSADRLRQGGDNTAEIAKYLSAAVAIFDRALGA